MSTPPDLSEISSRLARRIPVLAPPPAASRAHAAVALVFHEPSPGAPELLFIERATRHGDHWSGHVAFPGGRRQAEDEDLAATARRETVEEVGLELPPPLGRLDDYDARQGRRPFELVVSPFAFAVPARPPLVFNHEVADAAWIPLAALLDRGAIVRHRFAAGEGHVLVPAARHDRFVIWGMTWRMLAACLDNLGIDLRGTAFEEARGC